MLLGAVLLLALDFSVTKLYQKKRGAGLKSSLSFNAVNGLFCAVIFFFIHGVMDGFSISFTLYSMLMASVMALFALSYQLIGFRMLRHGHMAAYTLFLMTGGMTVPYLWGLLMLNEAFSILQMLGLILIFCGVICANFQKGKPDKKYWLMGGTVFLLNGLVSTVSKMHQIETAFATISSPAFVMLSGVAKAVFCGAALIFMRNQQNTPDHGAPSILKISPLILASAVIGGVSYLLQLIGAQNLPATVLYPIITGGSIIFTAIAGRIFYQEKISRKMGIGILLCFAGTCLFL